MAWFLFIDESGQDRRESPCEVLAGVAVQDSVLWQLICELHDCEVLHFGRRYSPGERELKGTKILKKKTFQHMNLNCAVQPADVARLAKEVLDNGATCNSVHHLKALALAKTNYVRAMFQRCTILQCQAFASIVSRDAPATSSSGLRKDYAYLFERFFYFLEDRSQVTGRQEHGILVFDELEKSQSHILLDQAHRYFRDTATGKQRTTHIVPEPFFVHSDLTTGIQIADLVAYCISWGLRFGAMAEPIRVELGEFADQIRRLQYWTSREKPGGASQKIGSFNYISDLRTSREK